MRISVPRSAVIYGGNGVVVELTSRKRAADLADVFREVAVVQ